VIAWTWVYIRSERIYFYVTSDILPTANFRHSHGRCHVTSVGAAISTGTRFRRDRRFLTRTRRARQRNWLRRRRRHGCQATARWRTRGAWRGDIDRIFRKSPWPQPDWEQCGGQARLAALSTAEKIYIETECNWKAPFYRHYRAPPKYIVGIFKGPILGVLHILLPKRGRPSFL